MNVVINISKKVQFLANVPLALFLFAMYLVDSYYFMNLLFMLCVLSLPIFTLHEFLHLVPMFILRKQFKIHFNFLIFYVECVSEYTYREYLLIALMPQLLTLTLLFLNTLLAIFHFLASILDIYIVYRLYRYKQFVFKDVGTCIIVTSRNFTNKIFN